MPDGSRRLRLSPGHFDVAFSAWWVPTASARSSRFRPANDRETPRNDKKQVNAQVRR
jgi:hypothetical protein